ncbi:MAG: translation initiation factor IF-3 [bacterium]|nr:translation initiation factor IF-3 [bacterium]
MVQKKTRINKAISAPEVRVIGAEGENLGVKPTKEALELAQQADLDLIEISPTAKPPVVRIMDWGKYQYQLDKEARKTKKKSHDVEIKGIRVRLGTGAHDLTLKAKRAEEFLKEGHRVLVQMTLRGREKYLDRKFIESRITKLLEAITVPFKISEGPKKGPRGLLTTIEPDHAKNKQISKQATPSDSDGESSKTDSPS